MSKKLGKLKTFELLDTLNWEFIKEYIVLNQSLEEKDEEIKPILDCIKKDQRISELEKEKQTAVKEFADELVGIIKIKETKNSEVKIEWEKFLDYVRKLLKERGIE